jgi:hypothetical protein
MNYLVNLVIQHVIGAFEQGWKTTVAGIIVAVFGTASQVIPLFQGKGIDQVNWGLVLSIEASAIGLVLAKDITITKVIEGAPKAKRVDPGS